MIEESNMQLHVSIQVKFMPCNIDSSLESEQSDVIHKWIRTMWYYSQVNQNKVMLFPSELAQSDVIHN